MKVTLSSDLLVPMPESAGEDMRLLGSLTSQTQDGSVSESIEVWAVNAQDRDGIIAVCNEMIAAMEKEYQENPEKGIEKLMKSFKHFVQQIGTAFEHEAPKDLLEVVNRELHKNLLAKDVIYMSGISRMEE